MITNDGEYLLAACRDDRCLQVFQILPTGRLVQTGTTISFDELVETNSSASLNETTCWENLEYLQASVVAACCQQILTVVGNHEIAWVSACCRITDLFQCSIRENMESTDAVILEASRMTASVLSIFSRMEH